MPRKKKKSVDEKISTALGVTNENVVSESVEGVESDAGRTGERPPDDAPIVRAEPVDGEVIDAEIVRVEQQELGYPTAGENPDIEEDYQETRKHLKSVREQAEDALDKMKEVADQGEVARQYEVVGQLIKANLEVAKAEIDLHKDMKDLRGQDGKGTKRASQHHGDVNTIFVGTTKELQDLKKAGKLPAPEQKVDESK